MKRFAIFMWKTTLAEISTTREEHAMQPDNIKSLAIATVTALGFLLATVPVAGAQSTFQCTGIISDGSTINGSLVLPANATCQLTNVTVVGNVQVGTGANLNVFPYPGQTVTIGGNIAAD